MARPALVADAADQAPVLAHAELLVLALRLQIFAHVVQDEGRQRDGRDEHNDGQDRRDEV